MKRSVMVEPGKIIFEEIPLPQPGSDQVRLKMKRIGVCGSDIHVFHGKHPYTSYPVVQGHEAAGVIDEVGKNVTDLQEGEIATVTPQVVCGTCYPCRTGDYHICDHLKVMGFQTEGLAQEYFVVDADKVVVIPEGISLDETTMIEPIAVAVHAVQKAGDITGKGVLVLGAGTIGNLVAQTALALGADQVLITDISSYKLEKARSCGLQETCHVREESLQDRILETFGPDKMDVTMECVGVQDTISQAVEQARKGSSIIVVGVFGDNPEVNLGFVQDRELSLIGTLMYQRTDYESAVQLVKAGKIQLEPMITHRFPFQDYLKAYHTIVDSQGRYMKVMIDL